MNFDTVLVAAITCELNDALTGASIDKVVQPAPLELVLSVYKSGMRRNLLISADPNAARIHFAKQRTRPGPTPPPAFCMLLRKYIEGGVIDEISQPLGFSERVILVKVSGQSKERLCLWIELMGRQSNVVLTNSAGLILGSIKRVSSDMSRLREIRAGIPYAQPPRQSGFKRDPMEGNAAFGLPADPFDSVATAEKWLCDTFRGVGSQLAKESVARASSDTLTGETVWYGLNDILSLVRLAEFNPVIYRNGAGEIEGAYPIPLQSILPTLQTKVETVSIAVEMAFGSRLEEDALEKERTALLSGLRKALKSNERQLLDVREGLLNSEQSDYVRESGELLLANIGKEPSGGVSITVDDYFSTESEAKRTIPIDPALTIHENAERYFRRFQKARDSKEILESRRTELERAATELQLALQAAEQVATPEDLVRLTKSISGELRPEQRMPGRESIGGKPLYDGHKIKSLRSPDGWEILVGENSTSNDFLTTKVASPSDIWLHARAVPSAHGVIRALNRPASVSTAALLLAAEQVAKRSSAKHARLVTVDYTLKKYVRKPRGSAPGQVTYSNETTIDVIAGED